MNLYQHLSRVMTKGRDFVPQIDGLRFVAIIGVIAFHVRAITSYHYGVALDSPLGSEGLVNRIFGAGCNGVELFFVISGFILALPFARQHLGQGEPVRLKAYYLRRLTRLEPPYILQLAIVFGLTCLVLRHQPRMEELYHQPDWLASALRHLGVSLFYGSGLVYQAHPQPNIVLWSLEIEVQFYLLAPMLARVFRLRPPLTRRLVIAGLVLLPTALQPIIPLPFLYEWTLLGKLPFFLAGFLLCDLHLGGLTKAGRDAWFWDLALVAATVAAIGLKESVFYYPLLPWLALLACTSVFRGNRANWLFSRPLLTTIGGMCYTIYMYHWLMISGLFRVTGKLSTHLFWLDLLIQFAVMSVIIVGICGVLFAWAERPFMKRDWPQRFRGWVTQNNQLTV